MRQIYFVRHAKSSWNYPELKDIERPLNKRGHRDAPIMAQKLSLYQPSVDLVICSSARRTKETYNYFSKAIKCKHTIIDERIYHAWKDTLIDTIRKIDNDVFSALIFGHNPGFTSVFNHFSNDALDNLPTCGIFELRSDETWRNFTTETVDIGHLLYPKMFNVSP